MNSRLVDALKMKMQPVAIILTDDKPADGLHFQEGKHGCVGSMLVAASRKNRIAFFDKKTYGCPGGGTGLGFGDAYGEFPIECLLSNGSKDLAARMGRPGSSLEEGERFYKNSDKARKWFESLPITEVPTEFVVFKPWEQVTEKDRPELMVFFANADQMSALVLMADYDRGTNQSVMAPFGAACQSIIFGYAEAKKEQPRGVLGFFDISQRPSLDRETLTFTVPYALFREMEANMAGSFLEMPAWHKLQERQ